MMRLSMCKAGSRVMINELFFEMEYLNRFYSMGLYPAASLEVIAIEDSGRIMIGVGGMELMLGKDIADNITVDLIEYQKTA